MILPLQLRLAPTADAAPRAWFLSGDDVEAWLSELARCGWADARTRLFVAPRSRLDRAPAGLLVVPESAGTPAKIPNGLPCRLVAGRLFVPVDATLHPPMTDAEIQALCPLPVNFLHPALGLSGFEEESTLRVWDLLKRPVERESHWNSARLGPPGLPEFTAIVLAQPPSLDDLFGDAQQEIGSEPPEALPPAPGEPDPGALSKSSRMLRRLLARGVSGMIRNLPLRHTNHRTWINDAQDWANRELTQVNAQLEQLRNKELHRLLHLLDTDPEAGLRHAIPMNHFAHRGTAPPGAQLGPRPTDFNPNRLGGGPADYWNVPGKLQEQLRSRYRAMANRELQLGRCRRAAYIYAELLGDLASAAQALKQGGLFREAALLFEEQLHNPLEAARCLAEGGMIDEAVTRLEKLERWLEIADLYERVGNRAAAEPFLRRVIRDYLAQGDVLGAAKLLDERLQATDEALELLAGAWPASRQAAGCVAKALQLFARLGRHEAAMKCLEKLGPPSSVARALAQPLLQALETTTRDYPHELVRHRATDFSRVLIARQLKSGFSTTEEAARLLDALTRLAPRDRLLPRDSQRFLAELRAAEARERRVTPAPPPLAGAKPVLLRRFKLPNQGEWLQLRSEWHWFYAVAVKEKQLSMVRGIWSGIVQGVTWDPFPVESLKYGFQFAPTGEQGRAVALATSFAPAIPEKKFPGADLFFNVECVAGTPAWLARDVPVAFGEESVWTAQASSRARVVLFCHDKRGKLLRTLDVTTDLPPDAGPVDWTRIHLAVLNDGVAVALDNRLVLIKGDGQSVRVELPGRATGLLPSLPHTRRALVVLLEHGAVMYWLGNNELLELTRDLERPLGTFVAGGPLALLSGKQLLLLDVNSRGVQKVARAELPGRPVGICGTSTIGQAGQFAVLDRDGEMTIYNVPG